jgi:hypothetical protein
MEASQFAERRSLLRALFAAAIVGSAVMASAQTAGNAVYRCPGTPILYTSEITPALAKEFGCIAMGGTPAAAEPSSTTRAAQPVTPPTSIEPPNPFIQYRDTPPAVLVKSEVGDVDRFLASDAVSPGATSARHWGGRIGALVNHPSVLLHKFILEPLAGAALAYGLVWLALRSKAAGTIKNPLLWHCCGVAVTVIWSAAFRLTAMMTFAGRGAYEPSAEDGVAGFYMLIVPAVIAAGYILWLRERGASR